VYTQFQRGAVSKVNKFGSVCIFSQVGLQVGEVDRMGTVLSFGRKSEKIKN